MNVINIFVGFNVMFLWKVHQGYIKGVKEKNILYFFLSIIMMQLINIR
jgi:hypothetical protein